MKTFVVPPPGSPVWRELYPAPPDLRVGRWCPLDDSTLRVRLDGWGCPVCQAGWDFQGRRGRWLAAPAPAAPAALWPPTAVMVIVGIPACAAAAVAVAAMLGTLDEGLLPWLAAVIASAAVLIPACAWVARRIADAPYRHSRAAAFAIADREVRRLPGTVRRELPACTTRALPAGTGEVADER